jgi:adenylate cyclase
VLTLTFSSSSQPSQERWFAANTVTVGRDLSNADPAYLAVSDDEISRQHARFSVQEGACWVEDLGSKNGTYVNDQKIAPRTLTRLGSGDKVRVGQTALTARMVSELPIADGDWDAESPPRAKDITATIAFAEPLGTLIAPTSASGPAGEAALEVVRHRLAIVYDLGPALSAAKSQDELATIVVEHIRRAFPHSGCWGLLRPNLKPHTYWPKDRARYSTTLARWAMDKQEAILWRLDASAHSPSLAENKTQCALYAPLFGKDGGLGVVYAESVDSTAAFDEDDLRLMAAIANQAALFFQNSLLQQQLGRDAAVLDALLRPFPPTVAGRIRQDPRWLRLGGEWKYPATVLFSDVRGFTAFSREKHPGDVMQIVNRMFYDLVPIVKKYEGAVDKYVGDALMAVFGSPDDDEQQWERAVRAALEMQAVVNGELKKHLEQHGLPPLQIGIGIHTGEVMHGFVGSQEHMAYTVIGDTVNRASRYCDGAGRGEILISPEVYREVDRLVEVGSHRMLKSKHPDTEPDLEAYVVVGLKK